MSPEGDSNPVVLEESVDRCELVPVAGGVLQDHPLPFGEGDDLTGGLGRAVREYRAERYLEVGGDGGLLVGVDDVVGGPAVAIWHGERAYRPGSPASGVSSAN